MHIHTTAKHSPPPLVCFFTSILHPITYPPAQRFLNIFGQVSNQPARWQHVHIHGENHANHPISHLDHSNHRHSTDHRAIIRQNTIAASAIPCLRFLMAAAASKKNQQAPPAPAAASTGGPTVVDPKFEWAEKAGSYVLRLSLPGFRKDDFRVQVDGAGRLTVRGSRPTVTGPGSLHKVFKLPATAAVDDIAGRFEAGVLTLTVPKRAGASPGAPPTSIEEVKRKQPGVAKEFKPNEEEIAKADVLKSRKQEQQKKEEDAKPKAPRSAAASPPQKPDVDATTADKARQQKQQEEEASRRKQEQQQKPASVPAKEEENVKPEAPQAAPPTKPEALTGADKAKAEVVPESLADKVRRRSEEEGANAAPMVVAKRAKTDGAKKGTASWGGGWKERVQGELKVLTDMKWADGLVEAARNNKEVVAIGIAAFSLGFLVSHKLFRKS
uniref:Uncharacterized protein n=1 Tax=Avena sativa TaxID=4498 RepID=A0ACD5TCY7_AVESA